MMSYRQRAGGPCLRHLIAGKIFVEWFGVDSHYIAMISGALRTVGYLCGLIALYAMWLDLSSARASMMLGEFWNSHHSVSLLISEAVLSRYIDPCGLVVSLGCEPFLWHPLVSTLLLWPAALVLLLLMGIFCGIGRLAQRRGRRIGGRSLKRSGER